MFCHLVLFTPRADLSASEREALVAAFRHAIAEIPAVRGVRIGSRVTHGAGYEQRMPLSPDYLAAIDFDDVEGLRMYLNHPAHEELGARFNASLASALIYDFEVGGVEQLSRLVTSRPDHP